MTRVLVTVLIRCATLTAPPSTRLGVFKAARSSKCLAWKQYGVNGLSLCSCG